MGGIIPSVKMEELMKNTAGDVEFIAEMQEIEITPNFRSQRIPLIQVGH